MTIGDWVTRYTYDGAGRLATVLDESFDSQHPFRYDYEANSHRLQTLTMPTGQTVQRSYDSENRLISLQGIDTYGNLISQNNYSYSKAGLRQQETNLKGVQDYGYNPQRELTSAQRQGDAGFNYTYLLKIYLAS